MPSEGDGVGSIPTTLTIMKTIILKDNEVFATRKKIKGSKILEICKNEEVQDKLAYWKYVCLPEIRANLTEHQNLVKFAFFNSKLGTTLYSVYNTKDKLKYIKILLIFVLGAIRTDTLIEFIFSIYPIS